MHSRKLAFLALAALSTPACKTSQNGAAVKINNGAEPEGDEINTYAAVVGIILTDSAGQGSFCTGSFVSDSVLLTAAHCVDRAVLASFDGKTSKDFWINPNWPRQGSACSQSIKGEYDLAVIRFPPNTYVPPEGTDFIKLATHEPAPKDPIKIVGYGNNQVKQYKRFCMVPEPTKNDGLCHLRIGTLKEGTSYSYSALPKEFTWKPLDKSGRKCPATCDRFDLEKVWRQARNTSLTDFVKANKVNDLPTTADAGTLSWNMAHASDLPTYLSANCALPEDNKPGGNLDSRSYQETGLGPKRVGSNVVKTMNDGVITFTGGLGGNNDGLDASSGRGDSGGPLFIKEGNDMRMAGSVSGGSLVDETIDEVKVARKLSRYNSTLSEQTQRWLQMIKAQEKLALPGVDPVEGCEKEWAAVRAEIEASILHTDILDNLSADKLASLATMPADAGMPRAIGGEADALALTEDAPSGRAEAYAACKKRVSYDAMVAAAKPCFLMDVCTADGSTKFCALYDADRKLLSSFMNRSCAESAGSREPLSPADYLRGEGVARGCLKFETAPTNCK